MSHTDFFDNTCKVLFVLFGAWQYTSPSTVIAAQAFGPTFHFVLQGKNNPTGSDRHGSEEMIPNNWHSVNQTLVLIHNRRTLIVSDGTSSVWRSLTCVLWLSFYTAALWETLISFISILTFLLKWICPLGNVDTGMNTLPDCVFMCPFWLRSPSFHLHSAAGNKAALW